MRKIHVLGYHVLEQKTEAITRPIYNWREHIKIVCILFKVTFITQHKTTQHRKNNKIRKAKKNNLQIIL